MLQEGDYTLKTGAGKYKRVISHKQEHANRIRKDKIMSRRRVQSLRKDLQAKQEGFTVFRRHVYCNSCDNNCIR